MFWGGWAVALLGLASAVNVATFADLEDAVATSSEIVVTSNIVFEDTITVAVDHDVKVSTSPSLAAVLDGQGMLPLFSVAGSLSLVGLTLQRGLAGFGEYGGAVTVESGAFLFATDCSFTDNAAWESGGALYIAGSLEASRCMFAWNDASFYGGAISVATGGVGTVVDCSFVNNTASYGSSIDAEDATTVISTTFSGRSDDASDVFVGEAGALTCADSCPANTGDEGCTAVDTDGPGGAAGCFSCVCYYPSSQPSTTPAPTTPAPTTWAPSPSPTLSPWPTVAPTPDPTISPLPTPAPTQSPTPSPTQTPTPMPSPLPNPVPTFSPTVTPFYIKNYEWLIIASGVAASPIVGFAGYTHSKRTRERPSALTLGFAVLSMANFASDVLLCYSFHNAAGWAVLCLNAFVSAGLLLKLLSELQLALDEVSSVSNGSLYTLMALMCLYDGDLLALLPWIPTSFTRVTGGFPHPSAIEFSAVAVMLRKVPFLFAIMSDKTRDGTWMSQLSFVISCASLVFGVAKKAFAIFAARRFGIGVVIAKSSHVQRGVVAIRATDGPEGGGYAEGPVAGGRHHGPGGVMVLDDSSDDDDDAAAASHDPGGTVAFTEPLIEGADDGALGAAPPQARRSRASVVVALLGGVGLTVLVVTDQMPTEAMLEAITRVILMLMLILVGLLLTGACAIRAYRAYLESGSMQVVRRSEIDRHREVSQSVLELRDGARGGAYGSGRRRSTERDAARRRAAAAIARRSSGATRRRSGATTRSSGATVGSTSSTTSSSTRA